ncbi:MAG: MarR family transcriptional regulator [Chloroflexi bacterium]|nr:MarR family transcriptional regulator [Chloroflexota bacterium]MQC47497.1 MarR family transcriptional regulator [Chloroflexota bacterium]
MIDQSSIDPATLAFRWNSIAIHLVRRLRQADETLGVPRARLSALSVLVFGGPHTLGDLARQEQVTPPTMTRIVTGLESMGLARRVRDEGDARLVRVEATPKGIEVMERGRGLRVQRLAAELGVLTPEDREVLARAASILLSLERASTD